MLDKMYAGALLPSDQNLPECDLTLKIDAGNLGKTQKVKKTMSEEEANEVRRQNEEIRKERDIKSDKIASRYACFKRDYMGAPILHAMNMALEGKSGFKPCQIDYRKNESYWVFGTDKDVSVTFEVSFEGETDIALARIFLLELNDAKRNV